MIEKAKKNIHDIVYKAFEHKEEANALLIFDEGCELAKVLTAAYEDALPNAQTLNFHDLDPNDIHDIVDKLSPGDLVILVQTTNFRLNEFRFRLELFNRSLAVIEHPHLGRMPESEMETYIDALAYDPEYYRVIGPKIKEKVDNAKEITLTGHGVQLIYTGPFEEAKLNIGDYSGMKNTGGMYPIGEVFTEPVDLEAVNGIVPLHAFGDQNFSTVTVETPILCHIEKGKIVKVENSTPEFDSVLEQIREEGDIWIRELGLGMNRAMTKERTLIDIGSYERMCGVHISLGRKHPTYKKPGFPKKGSRFHVDVFADLEKVEIDGETVFENWEYTL